MIESPGMRRFFVGLDMDTIAEYVGEQGMRSFSGAYVDGQNLHLGAGPEGLSGAARKLKGTVEIPWLPPRFGTNTGIGTYTDETGDTLIMFIHNSNGDHSIIWHHPGEAQARTIVIPELNLSLGNPVTGCALVNRELLIFCDGMEGDYPKMIDLPRADNTDKRFILRLYLPQSTELVDFREFRVTPIVNGVLGATIGPPTFANATTRDVRDFSPMVSRFAAQWNNIPALAAVFTAHGCAGYVELEAVNPGDNFVRVTVTDYINGTAQQPVPCVAERWNAYNEQWTFAQVRLSREMPLLPPAITMGTDVARKSSLLRKSMFQFAHGFRLHNKELSLVGPVSRIAVPNSGPCGAGGSPAPNYADVDFSADKWLLDPATRAEVEVVDIYARDGNDGAWFLVRSLRKWEWMYNRVFRFYNDGAYSPADGQFVEAQMTAVPPRSNGFEMFRDADDNQRGAFGGIKEGDAPACLDISLEVDLDGSSSAVPTASVEFEVIFRGFQDSFKGYNWGSPYDRNQAVVTYDGTTVVFGGMSFAINGHDGNPELCGQALPAGGIIVFGKGTDRVGISTQNVPQAALPCGINTPTIWNPPQGHAAAGRNVYDCTQTGTAIFNNCNDSHRAAVRRALENDSVRSTVRIDGLREGETYVFCMADFSTTLDDINSTGLEWQRKSNAVLQMGSVNSVSIKSTRDQCTVTIPYGAGGTVINCGTIDVADVTNPGILDGSIKVDGFVFDKLGTDYSTNDDIRNTGVSAERQAVVVQRYVTGSWSGGFGGTATTPWAWVNEMFARGVTPTDHNGYFCFFGPSFPTGSARAAVLGVTGDTSNPAGQITGFTGSSVLVNHLQVMNDINASKWQGDITGPLAPAGPNLHSNRWTRYIFANLNPSVSLRTHIRARLLDSSGAPLQGIGAIIEGGRYTQTDASGVIDLIAMGDAYQNENKRVADRLIWFAKGPCTVEIPIGGKIINVFITQFSAGNPYSETPDSSPWPNWFNMSDRVAVVTSVGGMLCCSRGGSYSVGARLGRWDGSGTAVQLLGVVRIPNLGEDLTLWDPLQWPPALFPGGLWSSGIATIKWTINNAAVDIPWAGRWEFLQFFLTPDGTRQFRLQWVAGEVTYSTHWDDTLSQPTATSYSSGNATEIYIVLTDSLTRYDNLNTDSMLGYLWEDGDMLRILSAPNGGQVFSVQEYEITGLRNTGQVGKWITLKADSSMPRIFAGQRIEIFRPAKFLEATDQVFYAVPDGIVPITDPYGTNPVFSILTGNLRGDTWMIPTNVPYRANDASPWSTVAMNRESLSFSDFFPSRSWDRGKAGFTDPDERILERGALMRYSNPFRPGTTENGLNIFDGLAFRLSENNLGIIMRMTRILDVILVNCTNGPFSIYVGMQQLQTNPDASTFVGGGVLGNIRPMASRNGLRDRMALVRTKTKVFWVDRDGGAAVQYGSNDPSDIAAQNNVHSYFTFKCMNIPASSQIVMGEDEANGEVLFSFPRFDYDDGMNLVEYPDEGIAFLDVANAWVSRRSMSPDCWGATSLQLYSFRGEKLWRHNATTEHNKIYGVDVDFYIDVPFNDEPFTLKVPLNVFLSRGGGWDVERVYTPDGQRSMIPASDFLTRRGGVSKAAAWMDSTTPVPNPLSNGDQLESTAFVFRLRHKGTSQCILVNATLFYQTVEDTQ